MNAHIFYSWQSDVRAAACRTLIEQALSASTRAIVESGTVEIVPVVDRDTVGIPGAPDIGATIFAKIDRADAFVADVTIVGRISDSRATPNPNVLIELGYALKALGENRIVLVQNTAFGGPELLPFDLRQKRVLTYSSDENSSDRSSVRRQLVTMLKAAVGSILATALRSTDTADGRTERWRGLLKKAVETQTQVEFESTIEIDVGLVTVSDRASRVPAILDGPVHVGSVDHHEFTLGFPVRGRSGLAVIAIPFGQVEDLWPGTDGRLHVLLKRGVVLRGGTSSFI